jgi:hypothetical protein
LVRCSKIALLELFVAQEKDLRRVAAGRTRAERAAKGRRLAEQPEGQHAAHDAGPVAADGKRLQVCHYGRHRVP